MTPESIYWIILFLTVGGFLFSQGLEWLNYSHHRQEVPKEVADFFPQEKYLQSLQYNREQTRFGFLTDGVGFLLSLGMLALGGFGWLDGWLRNFIGNPLLLPFAYFGVLGLASDLLTLPFQWHSTFVIEAKYGFNKTTVQTFFADKLKGYALAIIIGGGLLYLFMRLVEWLGADFWLWFGMVAAVIMLLLNMFYTSWLLPLFNKLTPLPDGELKTAIQAFAQKVSFPIDNIMVMDGSKRSAKANAFFSGMGKKKKIVLFDTLISQHTTEELVAVLAHEVGHYKKRHIVWSYLFGIGQVFFTLWVLSLLLFDANLSLALGGTQYALHLNLLAFGILFSPISGITGLFLGLLSRKNEFEADAYARTHFNGTALANALKKLSVETLSNLYPHPLYVFFHYSHPPLLQRLSALKTQPDNPT